MGFSSPSARQVADIASRALLVALFLTFAWANYAHWRSTGRPSGLATTLLEAWTASLFLVRRRPTAVSSRRLAWLAAPIGSFGMLLARPHGGGVAPMAWEAVQLVGLAVALMSLSTLGRSFGIVAANRGVKTRGLYSLVRHPAYAGYLIAYTGYVAENPSFRNVALLCVSTAFQLVRIREEERVLVHDVAYAQYRSQVRYRLVPLVY
jgi:protein-S-isoprenylcysteine O-methyltransferase Ste14